jgi:23S rRNA (guanosine2251-2'-O)-methyltransferase
MPRSSAVVGVNAISELFRRGRRLEGVLLFGGKNKRVIALVQEAKRRGLETRRQDPRELSQYGATQSQPAVFLPASNAGSLGTRNSIPEPLTLRDFLQREHATSSLSIFLDGITDPHNIGAIFRVADQFRAETVGLPGRRAGGITETVTKTSAGAVFHVQTVQLDSVAEAILRAKDSGFWIYGADADGAHPEKITFAGPAILVMGSEGDGLHRLVRERCDDIVAIPTWGAVDSLNVSVATGILAYELRRHLGPPEGEVPRQAPQR